MNRLTRQARWALVFVSITLVAAQVPNLSGTWKLNVRKSSWGKKPKPHSVLVTIEHKEPQIKYSGTSTDPNGEDRPFKFEGTLDGREYTADSAFGPAKITLKRTSLYTITSVLQSDDGKFQERTTTTISPDGRTLTRRLSDRFPERNVSWTEVYERQ